MTRPWHVQPNLHPQGFLYGDELGPERSAGIAQDVGESLNPHGDTCKGLVSCQLYSCCKILE